MRKVCVSLHPSDELSGWLDGNGFIVMTMATTTLVVVAVAVYVPSMQLYTISMIELCIHVVVVHKQTNRQTKLASKGVVMMMSKQHSESS